METSGVQRFTGPIKAMRAHAIHLSHTKIRKSRYFASRFTVEFLKEIFRPLGSCGHEMTSPSSVKDLKQNQKTSERSKGCVSLPFLGPSRVGAACPAITLRRGKDKSKKPMRKKDGKGLQFSVLFHYVFTVVTWCFCKKKIQQI